MKAFLLSDRASSGSLLSTPGAQKERNTGFCDGWPPEPLLACSHRWEGSGGFQVLRYSQLTCLEADLPKRLEIWALCPFLQASFIVHVLLHFFLRYPLSADMGESRVGTIYGRASFTKQMMALLSHVMGRQHRAATGVPLCCSLGSCPALWRESLWLQTPSLRAEEADVGGVRAQGAWRGLCGTSLGLETAAVSRRLSTGAGCRLSTGIAPCGRGLISEEGFPSCSRITCA